VAYIGSQLADVTEEFNSVIMDPIRNSVATFDGQKDFDIPYSINKREIFLNGILMQESDFVAIDGEKVSLVEACELGDVLSVRSYTKYKVADAVKARDPQFLGKVALNITTPRGAVDFSGSKNSFTSGTYTSSRQFFQFISGDEGERAGLVLESLNESSHIVLKKANGVFANTTALLLNDVIGKVSAHGSIGSNNQFYEDAALISFIAAEEFGTTSCGTNIAFSVTKKGTKVASEAIRVLDNGYTGFGVTLPEARIHSKESIKINAGTTAFSGLYSGTAATDTFIDDSTKEIHNNSISWRTFSDSPQYQLAISGRGGVKFYTSGTKVASFASTGVLTLDYGFRSIITGSSGINQEVFSWNASLPGGAGTVLGGLGFKLSNIALGLKLLQGTDGTNAGLVLTTAYNGVSDLPRVVVEPVGNLTPYADNTQTLGSLTKRWSTIFSGNGAVNTSDARLKVQDREITELETTWANSIRKALRTYKMISDVEANGEKAKWHFGVMAQFVENEAHRLGINPDEYAFLVKEPEYFFQNQKMNTYFNGCETRYNYGINYDQMLAFIIASI